MKGNKTNTVSIASLADTNEIMRFINLEWKQGHILATNKPFFLSEYQNVNNLNFVISKNENQEINAMLGFLKSHAGDDASIWTTMWKVSKSAGSPMLGIELLKYLRSQGYKSVMSNGINLQTEEIYHYLGFQTGSLDHYFIPNVKLSTHTIAMFSDEVLQTNIEYRRDSDLTCREITMVDLKSKFDFKEFQYRNPCKDLSYFERRFFKHLIYKYKVYGVFKQTRLLAFLVTRVVQYKESKCLRIVDFYGEDTTLSTFTFHLSQLMVENNFEYVDFYCKGLDENIIKDAGLLKLNDHSIVPNHFEPFVRKNTTLHYFTDVPDSENLRIYKADGDQDRPNKPSES